MYTYSLSIQNVYCIKIESGEDILETLQQGVTALGIRHGVILNGIGSISSYHVHVIETTNLPPGNLYFKDEGPYDVDVVNGYIIAGKVHAHIVVSNDRSTVGGHMEKGTTAQTFCVVTVADTSSTPLDGLDHFKGKKL